MTRKKVFLRNDPALLFFQQAAVMQVFMTGSGKQDNTVFPAVFFGKRIDF